LKKNGERKNPNNNRGEIFGRKRNERNKKKGTNNIVKEKERFFFNKNEEKGKGEG